MPRSKLQKAVSADRSKEIAAKKALTTLRLEARLRGKEFRMRYIKTRIAEKGVVHKNGKNRMVVKKWSVEVAGYFVDKK
jgi:hypothetical protein